MPAARRTRPTPREERRAELTAQMLDIVEARLKAGDTYAELSVERLIGAAGIARSTFYVYFEDKGVLLLALAEDVVEQLVHSAQRWWSLPTDATRADVEAAMRHILDTYREHAPIWSALIDAASYDARVRASFREVVDASAVALAEHIRTGQAAGSVRPEADARRTAAWLTWMTERGFYQLLASASPTETGHLAKAWTDVVWWTLYEGAPARA